MSNVLEKLECPGFQYDITSKAYEAIEGQGKTPCWIVIEIDGTKSRIERVLCPNLNTLDSCSISKSKKTELPPKCPYTKDLLKRDF